MVAFGHLLGLPCQPPAPPLPPPWGLSMTDPPKKPHAPPMAPGKTPTARDTHSQAGSAAQNSWPRPPLLSLLPALPPPSPRPAALAPSPGLLSHRNGAGCESVSRKGHLQPLASDVPAAWSHNLLEAPARDPRFSGDLLGLGVPVHGGPDRWQWVERVQARLGTSLGL